MQVIEKEVVNQRGTDCPDCGCGIYWSGDVGDIIETTEFVRVESFNDTFDGYELWEEFTGFSIDTDAHSCGCACAWMEDDGYSFEDVKNYLMEDHWVENMSSAYICGNCQNEYPNLKDANACCTQKENLDPEQLMEQILSKRPV